MLDRNIAAESHDRADQSEVGHSKSSLTPISDWDLPTRAVRAQLVRNVQIARSSRTDYLSANLFGEPAWDMLLELFVSALEQKRVTVGDLCIASNVPQTTALRWIDALLKEGLATRRPDPLDGRRIYVEISVAGYGTMQNYSKQLSHAIGTA